jgi:hypothetical protein
MLFVILLLNEFFFECQFNSLVAIYAWLISETRTIYARCLFLIINSYFPEQSFYKIVISIDDRDINF